MKPRRLLLGGALVWLVALFMLLQGTPDPSVPVRSPSAAVQPPAPSSEASAAVASAVEPAGGPAVVAFFIQVSGSNCGMLPRLLTVLYRPEHLFLVHFDAAVGADQCREARRAVSERSVVLVPSVRVTYRGVSMVLSTVDAMALALEQGKAWDYFVNMSGADYPLLKPEDMAAILGELPGPTSFVPSAKIPEPFRNRYRAMAVDPAPAGLPGQLHFLRTTYPYEPAFEVFKGSAWMVVSRGFADFVVSSDLSRRMLLFFAHTVSSPEHFFCTLIQNSEFAAEHTRRSLHRALWTRDGRTSCSEHNQHPCVLELQDWDKITKTGTFFARKMSANSPLLDKIDSQLLTPGGDAARKHVRLARDHALGVSAYTWPYA